jgi:tungstate transport system substrate-binding protein
MGRRYLTLLFAILCATMALTASACGDDDDDLAGTPTATAAGSTPTAPPSPTPTEIGGDMILATTTSTQDSGLLDVLIPLFEEQTGVEVKVIAVGTGAALEMAATGDADAVLVHAPASELKYVESGDLVGGLLVMHNDFVLVGPPPDPAGAKGAADLKAALLAIAGTGPFISRGDDSGTHKKELEIWKAAGVELSAINQREETGQGMGATLNVADQKRAYTLTDRGTFLSLRANLELEIVFEGDRSLLNIYSVYVVNPKKHDKIKVVAAEAFVAFMVAPETQAVIGDFKKAEYGESLFIPDAGKSVDSLGD